MEGKVKYFFIGLIMLLVILMFKDNNFSFDANGDYAYDNCDHYEVKKPHSDLISEGHWGASGWVSPTYNNYTTNELVGNGTWLHQTDNTLYWWFTSDDLLEFHPRDAENSDYYYCMYAGKSMHNFEHDPGWVTHKDSHDENNTQKHWTTNYHWQKGFNNTVEFPATAACMIYNYKIDPNSETKRGRLGVQGVIWAEGASTRTKHWWWLG